MSIDLAQLDQRLTSVETTLLQVQQRLGLKQFLQCCQAVRQEDSAQEPA